MNKHSKEKRNKVILVWMLTLLAGAAWGFGLLTWQLDCERKANKELEQRRTQTAAMIKSLSQREAIEQQVEATEQKLTELESQMATSDDTYSWINTTIRDFKQAYKVELPQIAQPVIADNSLLPKFPYRQASVAVAGTAYFHDLGLFIADFENRFPFARLINLEIDPASPRGGSDSDREKLSFKMEMIFLVKPNQF